MGIGFYIAELCLLFLLSTRICLMIKVLARSSTSFWIGPCSRSIFFNVPSSLWQTTIMVTGRTRRWLLEFNLCFAIVLQSIKMNVLESFRSLVLNKNMCWSTLVAEKFVAETCCSSLLWRNICNIICTLARHLVRCVLHSNFTWVNISNKEKINIAWS